MTDLTGDDEEERPEDQPELDDTLERDPAPAAPNAVQIHRTVRKQGEEELDRPFWALAWSGMAAGVAINLSLVAEGMLQAQIPDVPFRDALTSFGYPIGFILVILGRLQLFTESTVTAMLPLVTRPSMWALRRTARLWAIVIVANLVGTAFSSACTAYGLIVDPALKQGMVDVAARMLDYGFWATLANAIPAGFMIAMIAWILPNARSQSFWVIFLVTYVVSLGDFSHSIVGSDEAFTLLFTGHIGVVRALFGLILPALLGNLVGGAGLFALLAHAQVRSDVLDGALSDHEEGDTDPSHG